MARRFFRENRHFIGVCIGLCDFLDILIKNELLYDNP